MDMLRPLYDQYDSGFGAIANTFKSSADVLRNNPEGAGLHPHLPISFLYRHSIELFLKSCIIIFHKRFNIPYAVTPSGEPAITSNNKALPLANIHQLMPLYLHLKSVIDMKMDVLPSTEDWALPKDLDQRIQKIDGTDASSTFFRYPVTKDKPKDKGKSTVQPKDWNSMIEDMHKAAKPVKAVLFVDTEDNIVESFNHDADKVEAFAELLSKTAKDFSGLQMMIVWKLVEGR